MTLSLSVPSKTFLCGEYVALMGGPCVVLATEPRFHLLVTTPGTGKNPFHAQSPAGQFLAKYPELLSDYSFEFQNSVPGGGFGGSSAEFLLVSAFEQLRSPLKTEAQLELDLKKVLSDYGDLFQSELNKPSGADIVGQARGWMTAFHRKAGRIQNFSWDFPNLGFHIYRTGKKLATHEHLKQLEPKNFESLEAPCHQVWEALSQKIENHLLSGLTDFSRQLEKMGLQDADTMKMTQALCRESGVRVAKGCGAMGSDAILVVYDRRETNSAELNIKSKKMGLDFFANESGLAKGLQKDPYQ